MGQFIFPRTSIKGKINSQTDISLFRKIKLLISVKYILFILIQNGGIRTDYHSTFRKICVYRGRDSMKHLDIEKPVGKLLNGFISLIAAHAVPHHMKLQKVAVIRQAALGEQKACHFLLQLFFLKTNLGIQSILYLICQHPAAV